MLLVKTYLDKSKIHGTGVFAAEFIPKGSVIWKLQDGFDVIINHDKFQELPQITKEWIVHFGYLNEEEGGYVLCMDDAKYFNHSDDPNTYDLYKETIAAKDIPKGSEILSDYFTFDDLAQQKIGKFHS